MMFYYFTKAEYGIEAIRNNRLKVARILELNDIFEFHSYDLSNRLIRKSINKLKTEYNNNIGLICFSSSWRNPLQWAHYADKHHGLCLGFEIPKRNLQKIIYNTSKLKEVIIEGKIDEKQIVKLLTHKFHHWQYEQEHRYFVNLNECKLEKTSENKSFYFFSFLNVITGEKVCQNHRLKNRPVQGRLS